MENIRLNAISSDTVIKEYVEYLKEEYPDITFEQIRDAINHSFKYAKTEMEKDDLPIIRMKYLGSFRVFQKNLKNYISRNESKD